MPVKNKVSFAGDGAANKKKMSNVASSCKQQHPAISRRSELVNELGLTTRTWLAHLNASQSGPEANEASCPFLGLKNLGSTCYVNSLLQCLFHIPEFRRLVLSFEFEPKHRHKRNVAFQLQLLFARLLLHRDVLVSSCVDTSDFVKSFGMEQDGHREQHDVQELNRVLLDALDQFSQALHVDTNAEENKDGQKEATISSLFQGSMVDEIVCTNCHHTRTTASTFFDVSLPLCSFNGEEYDREAGIVRETLDQCFDSVTATDVIEGVYCEACSQRSQTAKRQVFDPANMPLILTLQLVRMQYNVETNRREKLLKHVELPQHVDLARWSTSAACQTDYHLFAIIAHRGTAYHGHYYAFINLALQNGVKRWFKFDDDTVTPVQGDDILEYIDPKRWSSLEAPGALLPAEQASNEGPNAAPQNRDASVVSSEQIPPADGTADDDANLDEFFADLSGGPVKARKNTVSGQAYYLLYRKGPEPIVSTVMESPSVSVPAYVSEIVAQEALQIAAKKEELLRLSTVVPIVVVVGETKRALVAGLESATPPLRTVSIDALETWTGEELAQAVERALSPSEAAELRQYRRIRAFNATSGVMGCVFAFDDTLYELGYRGSSEYPYHVAVETQDLPFLVDESVIKEWDVPIKLWIQSDANPDEFVAAGGGGGGARALPCGIPFKDAVRALVQLEWPHLRDEDLLLTSNVGHIIPEDSRVTQRHCQEVVYVERARFAVDNGDSIAPSRAAHFFYRQQLMSVECTVLPRDVSNPEGAALAGFVFERRIDRRISLRKAKEILCEVVSLNPSASQLLIDNNSREIRNMDLSLSAAAVGSADGPFRVRLLPYPPIPQDHTFVDVFEVVQPINYAAPVTFIKRLQASPDTLISDLVADALPGEDPKMLRARLLPPGQKVGLGTPMLLPTVLANASPAHHQGGGALRVAFERLLKPEVLEKGTLILHLHRWLSEVGDCKLAFGDGVELQLHKEMPASVLVDAIGDLLHLQPEAFDAAPAKYYAIHSHDTCFTKVPWGILHDTKILAKPVAAYPLKLEMDDIILVRATDEEWTFVSEEAKNEGHLPFGGASTTSGQKGKGHNRTHHETPGGTETKKKARCEKSIAIKAVWELDDEEEDENGVNAQNTPATMIELSSAAAAVDDSPPMHLDVAACLPFDTYDAAIHGTLDDTCKICFCQYEQGEVVTVLTCHHMFHRDCLAAWVNTKAVCPQCMAPIG